jgi:ribonuclease HIII
MYYINELYWEILKYLFLQKEREEEYFAVAASVLLSRSYLPVLLQMRVLKSVQGVENDFFIMGIWSSVFKN